MELRGYWNDVLRSGALLGLVMLSSHILEQYVLVYSDVSVWSASLILVLEGLASCILFIYLLVRYARRRVNESEVAMGYGSVLSYILLISMLAGVIVGVGNTVFTSAMGYDLYVEGLVERINEVKSAYINAGINSEEFIKPFDGMIEKVSYSTQPTMFQRLFSSLYNYMLFGGLPGLLIAGFVKRDN